MRLRARRLPPVALAGLCLALAALAPGGTAPAHATSLVDARVASPFAMHGQITTAVRVAGERRGQQVTRNWQFSGLSCAGNVCQRLRLRRQRSAGHYDTLTLQRVGVGQYAGSGRFTTGLKCRGRVYRRGESVPYRIAVAITQSTPVEGIQFASGIIATYTNPRRIDHTICPTGPSHDAAQYTGTAAPLPSPPTAGFTVGEAPNSTTASFDDTSKRGATNAKIVGWHWDFGDPNSGPANTASTPHATHTFSGPGTYTVSLTVIDANGLSDSHSETVVAPAPPAPARRH